MAQQPNKLDVSESRGADSSDRLGGQLSQNSFDLLKEGSDQDLFKNKSGNDKGVTELDLNAGKLYAQAGDNSGGQKPENQMEDGKKDFKDMSPEERREESQRRREQARRNMELNRLGGRAGAGKVGDILQDGQEMGEILKDKDGDGKVSEEQVKQAGQKGVDIFLNTQKGRDLEREANKILPGLGREIFGRQKGRNKN